MKTNSDVIKIPLVALAYTVDLENAVCVETIRVGSKTIFSTPNTLQELYQ